MADATKPTEVPVTEEEPCDCSKPGLKTTEFWTAFATISPLLFKAFESGDWKVQIASIVGISVITVAYIVTRGSIKVG